tara:strand:- start:150 stop:323 length:174 start_codon:yes stop_codon:yes gene_type:complete
MNQIIITSAQYTDNDNAVIKATIDGVEMFVPLDPANRHYAEIIRQVAAGELTIADAD